MKSDAENYWVVALQNGEREAIDHFYEMYYGQLTFFGDKIISNIAHAEDLAISAITRLWERRKDFQTSSAIQSFLYQTVKNACFDYLSHLKVKTRAQAEILSRAQDDSSVETKIIHSQLIDFIFHKINELPSQYKEVIHSVYLEGLSHAEASEKLGITEVNLRNRKSRALQALRGILAGKESGYWIALLAALGESIL